jgi:gamma-glutamylputrescine oxidase
MALAQPARRRHPGLMLSPFNARSAHAPSWYAATANPAPSRPALVGAVRADVCIIGAGYTGLIAGLELAQAGYRVLILEARRVGWGASGRNGGQIVTGFNQSIATIRRMVGAEDAARLWQMSQDAKAMLAGLVDEWSIDCGLSWGYLLAAIKPRHERALAEHLEELHGLGYADAHMVDTAGMRAMVACQAYRSGLYDAGSGQLHPLNYALGLARAAEAAGAVIYEETEALGIETGSTPSVRTAHASVKADFLILAGNAYLGGLAPAIQSRVMPAGTYIIGTAPLGKERAEALIPAKVAVADLHFVLNYYRLSPDHRLLFGGGVSYTGFDGPALRRTMQRAMLRYFPQLADVGIDYCWGGHVAITMNRLPHLGRISPCVYFAQGYSGQGVALTAIAARALALAIKGQAEKLDVFARLPHRPFPGPQALRMPALAMAMLWYRLRDAL